jgi:hypothetical protein
MIAARKWQKLFRSAWLLFQWCVFAWVCLYLYLMALIVYPHFARKLLMVCLHQIQAAHLGMRITQTHRTCRFRERQGSRLES